MTTKKQRYVAVDTLEQSKQNEIESLCKYLAEFKNALVVGFGSDDNWNMDGFEAVANDEGGIPLFTRNIPIINPKHSYNLMQHRVVGKGKKPRRTEG